MRALSAAKALILEHVAKRHPHYLQVAHYFGEKKMGRGVGYVYPHDQPGGVADQDLLPEEVRGERFYEPTDRGFEAELARRLEEFRRRVSGGDVRRS
jgi:putative ATPase